VYEVLDLLERKGYTITPGIYPNGGLGKNSQIAIHAELGMSMNLLSTCKC
jgi:hypothetical protein